MTGTFVWLFNNVLSEAYTIQSRMENGCVLFKFAVPVSVRKAEENQEKC
jgi:hypothetical protein